MSRDEELDSLLGAYAVDALDGSERLAVEHYLERSPEARAELRRLALAVDALALSSAGDPADDEPVREALAGGWERIREGMAIGGDDAGRELPVLRLDSRRPAVSEPSAPAPAAPPSAPVISLDARRSRRYLPAILGVAAALLLGLAGGAVLTRGGDSTPGVDQLAEAALEAPGARTGELSSTAGDQPVRVVVAPDGQGYLFADSLPALPADRTYQLWSVEGESVVSLGVLGSDPTIVSFPAGASVTTLAITAEVAPGVAVSQAAPVVSGTLA